MDNVVRFKQLDYNNPNDTVQLSEILDRYLANESEKKYPVYDYFNQIETVEKIKNWFKIWNNSDFIIVGRYNNDILDQIIVTAKLGLLYNRPNANIFPYWFVFLLYADNAGWRYARDDLHGIHDYCSCIYEMSHYTKFYTVQKLPRSITEDSDVNKIVTDIISKRMPYNERYIPMIENIFSTQQDIENYNFPALKMLLPRKIMKPVMLMSMTLRANLALRTKLF